MQKAHSTAEGMVIYFEDWVKTALPINLLFPLLFVQLVYVGIRWYVKG